ncbi:MAG: peptidoglycan DD-metalloendopeptidase family protein [Rhodospirillales bacterium]|nr:peptidoglycan DD-metalloendopeptidase family protein [Rhodospirillales bacterium]
MRRAVASVILAITLAATVLAQAQNAEEVTERLDELGADIEDTEQQRTVLSAEATAIADELDLLRIRLLATDQEIRTLETERVAIELELQDLKVLLAHSEVEFAARWAEFGLVLAALQRIARQPADMLLAMPTSPTDTHRMAMLLASVSPVLQTRVDEIRQTVESVAALRDETAVKEAALAATLERIREEQATAAATVDRKAELLIALRRDEAELAQRQEKMAAEAESLKDLLVSLRIEEEQRSAEATEAMTAALEALSRSSFSDQRGRLPLPVAGTIVAAFGDTLPDGRTSEGFAISSEPGSRIVTPFDGEVVYTGAFGDYGHLLIIDNGEGYHTVLAGFSRIDVVLGQWLLAGEPIGAMASDGAEPPVLYVELRHNGDPINPQPWMVAGYSEVSGG